MRAAALPATIDGWADVLGEESPPPPPELFFLDPDSARGALTPGDHSWHDAESDYSHGCEVALRLSADPYASRFDTPWGQAAVEAQLEGERTSLLPWEV